MLWYIFGIPAFFFFFVAIYRPFDTFPALEMERNAFFFNATMLMCIQMGVLLVEYAIRKYEGTSRRTKMDARDYRTLQSLQQQWKNN